MHYEEHQSGGLLGTILRLPLLLISDAFLVAAILVVPLGVIYLLGLEASTLVLGSILIIGLLLTAAAYQIPEPFGFSLSEVETQGITLPPEPLKGFRAALRMLTMTGLLFYALLPTSASNVPAPAVSRLSLADYQHNLDRDAVLQKINAIRSEWPHIMENSTGHDLTYVYGTVATILMSGYRCDTVSNIISHADRVAVWCNYSKYRYTITSYNGLPVARPEI